MTRVDILNALLRPDVLAAVFTTGALLVVVGITGIARSRRGC